MTDDNQGQPWDKRLRELADRLDDAEMFRSAVEMLDAISDEPLDDRLPGVGRDELAKWIETLERTVSNLRARMHLRDE